MIIHDDYITLYQMNFDKSEMIFNIFNRQNNEKRRIIFQEVLTYYFEGILQYNQLLDISEVPIERFMLDNKEYLNKLKAYSWPIDYESSYDLLEFLNINQLKYFIIYSSFGLNGWILAKNIIIEKCDRNHLSGRKL